MSSSSNLLVSGGVDTNLISYTTEKFPKISRETNSYPQRPLITLSKGSKLLCCQFPQKIEVWALGTSTLLSLCLTNILWNKKIIIIIIIRSVS
jgi:hypothetical protein